MPVRSRLTEDFRKSGQTQEAFCKENKISIHILRYHLYKKDKHRRSIPVGKKDLFPDSVTAPFISFPGNPQNDFQRQRYPVTIISGQFTISELLGFISETAAKAPC